MRAGSTLQFQIAAQLVEEAGLGKRVEWVKPPCFPKLREKYAHYTGWKVFKSHICMRPMVREFRRKNALGVYVFRDLRDVFVSATRKDSKSFEQLWEEDYLDVCLQNFQKWTRLPRVLVSKYEEMIADLPGEVARIAAHLGLSVDRDACERIASAYSLDQQLMRIERFKRTSASEQRYTEGPIFDSVTLLHTNHIQSGRSGEWAQVLSLSQAGMIEGRARNWLKSHGYEVTNASVSLASGAE